MIKITKEGSTIPKNLMNSTNPSKILDEGP